VFSTFPIILTSLFLKIFTNFILTTWSAVENKISGFVKNDIHRRCTLLLPGLRELIQISSSLNSDMDHDLILHQRNTTSALDAVISISIVISFVLASHLPTRKNRDTILVQDRYYRDQYICVFKMNARCTYLSITSVSLNWILLWMCLFIFSFRFFSMRSKDKRLMGVTFKSYKEPVPVISDTFIPCFFCIACGIQFDQALCIRLWFSSTMLWI